MIIKANIDYLLVHSRPCALNKHYVVYTMHLSNIHEGPTMCQAHEGVQLCEQNK